MHTNHPPTSTPSHPAQRLLPLTATLLLIGFALRLYRLDTHALSGDEAFTIVNWTRQPLQHVLTTIALIDPQPPFTLLSINAWVNLVGDTEFAARALSVLASTLALATLCALARVLFAKSSVIITLFALTLATTSPFQIWYAQDVRSYALWIATSSLSAWAFLAALRKPSHPIRWAAYVLTATISMYTFYLEAFFLFAQNLFALSQLRHHTRTMLKSWLLSQLGIALLLMPWFVQPALRSSGYQPTAGPPNIPWAFEALLFGETIPVLLQSPLFTLGPHVFTLPAALAILLTALAFASLPTTRHTRPAIFLALYTLLPILLLSALATVTGQGYFRPRYIAAASAPFTLLVAVLLTAILHTRRLIKPARVAFIPLITLALFAINSTTLWTYYFDYSKAPAWREIAATLDRQTEESDLIIRNYPDPAFDYYYTAEAKPVLLPPSPNTPPALVHQDLIDLIPNYRYIWFMPVPVPYYDPDQIVYHWLETNTQRISEQWIDETHLLQYAGWEINPTMITNPLRVTFTQTASLEGYRITPSNTPWKRGTTLYLETFWQPLARTDQDLTLFIHLIGPPDSTGSPLWAQDDHPPQRERLTTHAWQPGILLRDVAMLTIPADAPPGTYTIAVGIYDPRTLARIPVRLPGGFASDSVELLTFELP